MGVFCRTAYLLLGITATTKLVTVVMSTPILAETNLILGVSYRTTLALAAAAEIFTIVVMLIAKTDGIRAVAILSLSAAFWVYRIAASKVHQSHCPCLGNLSDWLHLSSNVTDAISLNILLYLSVGSLIVVGSTFLRRPWRN
jgi:hypothetical protein